MKKKLLLITILVLTIFISGCDKKESLVCESRNSDTGSSNSTKVTLNFVNSKLSSIYEDGTITFDRSYTKYIDTYKESLDSIYKIKGVNYSATVANDTINVKISADGKNVNKLMDILNIKDEGKDKIKKELTSRGYNCK